MIKKENLQFAADLLITALQDAKDPTKQEFTQVSYRDDDTAYLLMNSGSVSIRLAHRGKDVNTVPVTGVAQQLPFPDFFADPANHKKLERQESGCYVVKNADANSYAPRNNKLCSGEIDLADYMTKIRTLYVTQTTKLPAFELESVVRLVTEGKILYLIKEDQTATWKRISTDCGQHFTALMPGMLACAKKDEENCFFGLSMMTSVPVLRLCWPNRNIDAAIAMGHPLIKHDFTFYTETQMYTLSGIQRHTYEKINKTERKERKESTMAKGVIDASLQALQNLQHATQAVTKTSVQDAAAPTVPQQQQRQTFVAPDLAQQVAAQVLPKQNIGNVPLQRQPLTQVPVEHPVTTAPAPAQVSEPVVGNVDVSQESVASVAASQEFSTAVSALTGDSKEDDRIEGVMTDLTVSSTAVNTPVSTRSKRTKSAETASVSAASEETVSVSSKMQTALDKSDSGEVQSVSDLLELMLQSIQNHLEISKTQLKMIKLIQKQYKMEQKNNPSWREKYEELQSTFNTLKSLFNGR